MITSGNYRPDDYIVRQIVQFAEGIARILGLLREKEEQTALTTIDREIEGLLMVGHKAEAVFTLENDELNTLIDMGAVNRPDYFHRCFYLAALLEFRGDAFASLGKMSQAQAAWVRAMDLVVGLHEGLAEEAGEFDLPDFAPPLDRLRGKVPGEVLPLWLQQRVERLPDASAH